jgi:uncharacterized protein with PIN domain
MRSDEKARRCPECGAKLVFRDNFPVLTEVRRQPAVERLRYTAAWVCETTNCDYAEAVEATA